MTNPEKHDNGSSEVSFGGEDEFDVLARWGRWLVKKAEPSCVRANGTRVSGSSRGT
jgi:hypothetical protein